MKNKEKNLKKDIKIIPLGSRVLVEPMEKLSKQKTDSGIFIPENTNGEKSEEGRVVALGEGSLIEGKLVPLTVKIGDKVIFSKYSYEELNIDEKKYFLVKEENILAVIK